MVGMVEFEVGKSWNIYMFFVRNIRILGVCSVKKNSETSRIHIGKCTKYVHAWCGMDKLWGLPKPCRRGKVIITSLRRDRYYLVLSCTIHLEPCSLWARS